MSEFKLTERNKVKSAPVRADYNIKTVYDIVDSGLICHVGFTDNDQPYVIPTIHVRIDNTIYIHGSNKSRLIRHLAKGSKVCITVTKLDGLVLARSVFHHSMNYRSAVVFGTGRLINEREDKLKMFEAMTEKLLYTPGERIEFIRTAGIEMGTIINEILEDENGDLSLRFAFTLEREGMPDGSAEEKEFADTMATGYLVAVQATVDEIRRRVRQGAVATP